MPTPDGREWLTSEALAERFFDALVEYDPRAQVLMDKKPEIVEAVKQIFADLYGMEFKVARLTEQLKDSILAGDYGPLEVDGVETQAGSIYLTFKDIYTESVLACYDENGNYIC